MKSTLLTTTALIALAGAAYADGHAGVAFSGSATIGYNDDVVGDNDGFYADAELDVTMTAALDNGITVTATADVDELDAGDDFIADGVTIEIASETASLTYGDTDPSADKHWSGVDGDTVGDFRGATEHEVFDAILRGEATFGGVTGSISYGTNDTGGGDPVTEEGLGALQVAAVAELGGFTIIGAYEAEDELFPLGTPVDLDSQFGVSASGTVAGFDVMASYLSTETDSTSSLGLSVAYPVGGGLTIGGYYSLNESDDADAAFDNYGIDVSYENGPFSVSADYDLDEDDAVDASWEIDANYDTGLGAIVHVGANSSNADEEVDFYVAGTYDLGGGATLLVSYTVDDDASEDDEVGEDELQTGTTVEVSFSF